MNQTVTITPENGTITIVDVNGKKIAEIDVTTQIGFYSGLTTFNFVGRGTTYKHYNSEVKIFDYEFNQFAAGSAEEIGDWI